MQFNVERDVDFFASVNDFCSNAAMARIKEWHKRKADIEHFAMLVRVKGPHWCLVVRWHSRIFCLYPTITASQRLACASKLISALNTNLRRVTRHFHTNDAVVDTDGRAIATRTAALCAFVMMASQRALSVLDKQLRMSRTTGRAVDAAVFVDYAMQLTLPFVKAIYDRPDDQTNNKKNMKALFSVKI